jgi:hypothetical protein
MDISYQKRHTMRLSASTIFLSLLLLSACSITQSPVKVSDSAPQEVVPVVPSVTELPVSAVAERSPTTMASPKPAVAPSVSRDGLTLTALPQIARQLRKDPSVARKYAGQILQGKAKFVKTAKGNPNAVVADVRVSGLGEVSLWCRNVTEGTNTLAAGKAVSFEGLLTGSIYTSEDFSHDVTLKDCRFHE